MKKYIFFILVVAAAILVGCQSDDYLIDGGIHNPKVNMTTYEYLQTNPVFDTLLILIDKAGLKETINGNVTFFAPNDYVIKRYLTAKRGDVVAQDPFSDFTLEDIPVQDIRDSLKMYIIPGKVNRDVMTKAGTVYTSLMGNRVAVSLIPVDDEYADIIGVWPEYVFFTTVVGQGLDKPGEIVSEQELDKRDRCQTSGIETNTGIIHVLENSHTMWYFVQTHFIEL